MIHLRLKRSAATPATGLSTNSVTVCAIMTPPSARPEAPVSCSTRWYSAMVRNQSPIMLAASPSHRRR